VLPLRQQILALDPPVPLWVDTVAFEAAAASAHGSNYLGAYDDAIALYGGDLLPEDRYEDWARRARDHLQELYLALLLDLAQLHQSRSATGPAGAALQRVLVAEPEHEVSPPLIGRLVTLEQLRAAWVAAAKRPHALLIAGEAGIGKTRVAEEALALATRSGTVTAAARCYVAEGELPFAPLAAWLRTPILWERLLAMDPVWHSEVARIVPELLVERPGLSPPGPLAEGWQRLRLFEALARALAPGGSPLLLVLDDLQWCDQETVDWLHYRLRRPAEAPLLVLMTMRSEEIKPAHPLVALTTELRHDRQLSEIRLGPLDAAETATLAAQITGRALNAESMRRLYAVTEGHPLIIVETLRAGGPDAGSLPASVQVVLETRLRQLSAPARELVSLAAVIGREFSFDLLEQASEQDKEALVACLDELWQRQIVREQVAGEYDFSHDKLREVAYTALSPTRRRALHARVAQAMEAVHAYGIDVVSGQIAAQYEQAGAPEQALPYYERAAEAAWRAYSSRDAITNFERALVLLSASIRILTQQGGTAARLQERLGDVRQLTGQIGEARAAYERALEESLEPDPDALRHARLYQKIGKTYTHQDRLAEAARSYEQGEEALGKEPADQVSAAEWWQEWFEIQCGRFILHYLRAEMGEMDALLELSRPIVEPYATSRQRMRFLEGALVANLSRERYVVSEKALGYVEAQMAAAQESGDEFEIAGAHFEIGWVRLWHGDLEEAEAHLQAALAFAERTGVVEQQDMRGGSVRSVTYLAVLYRKRGHVEQTQRLAKRALVAATAAQWPVYMATAQANLAWVAWRQGHDAEAQTQALAALDLWKQAPEVYAFQWLALWPLIALARRRNCLAEAIAYAHVLLNPQQQRLPDALVAPIEAAIQAADAGHQEALCTHLDQALGLAGPGGYL
jgi:tetratricopeptide (TPR) repeat protein